MKNYCYAIGFWEFTSYSVGYEAKVELFAFIKLSYSNRKSDVLQARVMIGKKYSFDIFFGDIIFIAQLRSDQLIHSSWMITDSSKFNFCRFQ